MTNPLRAAFLLSVFLLCPIAVQAGQLTIAVIQYLDARDVDALKAGFASVDLSTVTNSDQVESKDPSIRGGTVLFAQTIPVSSKSGFSSSTRLKTQRADVSGQVNGKAVKAEISIQDGVDAGIRKFSRSVYSGAGTVVTGQPTIIGMRESSGRTQSAVKGQAKLKNFNFVTLIVAELR